MIQESRYIIDCNKCGYRYVSCQAVGEEEVFDNFTPCIKCDNTVAYVAWSFEENLKHTIGRWQNESQS